MKRIKGIFIGIGKNKHASASCSGITYNVKEKDLPKLHKAAWIGELAKVKKLVKKDSKAQDRLDKENRTALHLACAGGHSEVVKELLTCSAKIDSVDNMFKTPLMRAIECNHEECVEELLKYNPNLEAKDLDHNTALHIAIKEGHATIVSHIINTGADVNVKNKEGSTPLILSVLDPTKRDDITKLLLDKGADPNQVDNEQRSALHYACHKDSINHVNLLLAKNASTTLKDLKDWTAEDMALIKENHTCSQIVYAHNIKHRKLFSGSIPASDTPRAAGSLTSSNNLDSLQNFSKSFPGAGLGMPQMPLVDSGEDSDDQTVSKHSGPGDRQNSWADDTDLSSLTDDHKHKGVPVKTSLTKHLKIGSDEDGMSSGTDEEGTSAAPVASGKLDPNRRRSPTKFRKVLVSTGDVSGKVRPMYSRTPTPDADLHQSGTISPLPNKYNASSKIPDKRASFDQNKDSTDAEDDEIPLKNVGRVSFSEEKQVISVTDENTDIEEDEDEEVEPIKKRRIETPQDSQLDGYSPTALSKSSNLSKEQCHVKKTNLGFATDDIFDVSDPEFDENDKSNTQDADDQEITIQSQTTTPRGILKKHDVGKSPTVLPPADSNDDDSDWDSTKRSETDNLARSAHVRPAVNSPEVNSDIEASLNPDNSQMDKTSQWDSTEEACSPRTPRDIHDFTNQGDYLHKYDTYQEDTYTHKETVTSFKVRQEVHPSVGVQTKPTVPADVNCVLTRPLNMLDNQYMTKNNVSVVNTASSAGTKEFVRITKQQPQHLDSNEDSDWDSENEISNPEVDESAIDDDGREVAVSSLENTPRTVTESISEWELEKLREAEEKRKLESKLLQELEEEEERQKQWEDEHSRRQAQVLLEAEEELRREQMFNDSDISDFSESDSDLANSARQQDLDHSNNSQPVSENSQGSHQSENSILFSLTSPRMHKLKKSPQKLVVTQFFTHSAAIRDENPVKIGEIENESPALDGNNHHRGQQDNNSATTNVGFRRLTYQHQQEKMNEHKDLIEFDDNSDDEVTEKIYDDNEQIEIIKIDTVSRQEASVQQPINTDLQYNGVRYELESSLLGTPPPIPSTAPPEKVLLQLSDETSIDEYDAPATHSFKISQVTSISHLPEISGVTGLYQSGLEAPFGDDGLSVTSTENGDINSSYRTEQLPYERDMLVNMNLSDSGAILKLQEHFREHRKQLEHERSQRQLLESKNKQMVKEREDMQKAISSLKSQKIGLDQLKLDLEANIRNLEFSVIDEEEKKKNAEALLKKTKEQLAKKEEQYSQEMEAKQRAELTLRNIQVELRSTRNKLKELEDEKAALERLLANEKNARHFYEKISDNQQRLQQHMKEEYMKTSQREDDKDAQEVPDDDIQHAHDLVGKYRHEITALKAEIQSQRTRLTEENMILSMENERLQQKMEDLQSDVNQHQKAICTAAVQQTMHKDQLVSESTMLADNLDKERVARENLESELESYRTRLQSSAVQLEKMQQVRNDLERRLHTDHEEWDRQLERKEKELLSLQEKLSTIMISLNVNEAKLSSVENELQISNRTALERSNQYQQAQKELQLYKSTHGDLESNYRHEKEQNIKLTTKLESLQDRLSILQHENLSIKRQADLAQHMANERSGYDLQDKLNTMIAALKADHDKARALIQDKNNNLQETINHLREQVRNSDNRRSNLEQDIRSLNLELNNLIKKLSVSEASLDVSTKAREHLEQEKLALKMELENLHQKYNMAHEKTLENQSRMSELVGRLDGMEESRMLTRQQLAEKSATMQVFKSSKQDFKENNQNNQKLQIENVQLKAELNSVKQKIYILQRDLDDSQKVRSSLETLCSSLKSTNAHLEEKLGPEQLREVTTNMAQLDRHKQEAATQLEEEKRKTRKAMELKKFAETKLEAEQDKCTNLQKEVASLKAYLRVAKKRLKDQGSDDVLDTNEHRFSNLHSAFDKERQAMEEMVVAVKTQNTLEAGYTEKTSHEETKKEIETRYRLDLNRKLDKVNNYLEEQARTQQRLDLNRDEQETKLKNDKKKLEEELSNLQIKYEQALTELETKELEARRYHELYESEMHWRMRLSDQLYKSTDLAFEVKNIMERPKTHMFGSLSNLSMNAPLTDHSKTNGSLADHALSNRLKAELDRSIAKHLEAGPLDRSPYVRNDDSFITTTQFTRASAKYHDILKRKFCV